jgi:hypothetical protein
LNSFLAGRCTGGKMASRAEQQEMCAASIGGWRIKRSSDREI